MSEAAGQPQAIAPKVSEAAAEQSALEAVAPSAPTADEKTGDAEPEKKSDELEPTTTEPATTTPEKPAAEADVEMKEVEPVAEPAAEAEATEPETKAETENTEKPSEATSSAAPDAAAATSEEGVVPEAAGNATPSGEKGKARRKSGVPEHKGKKLAKKQSKAKILHLDAQPGDHFFAKLKGFPPWPVIVCDDSMLPQTMLSSRPVSAARPDGTYRDDFADGGKRVADRTYAVMYLHTNEFSWTRNSDLEELDPTVVASLIAPKMRKDLQQAHLLAEEQNSLDHYKQVLREFEEARMEALEAKAAKAKAKKEKTKKAEAPPVEDEDVDMPDAEEADDSEAKKQKSKKRKAEEDTSTPQRSDSVKKPKIKLTTSSTPKTGTNGVSSPKSAKESTSKPPHAKAKPAKANKEADGKRSEKVIDAPKEPELSLEERHQRKEKEILFLRHRLQKGLLNRDVEPKEEEMKAMSEFLAKLETFPDLEVSIIKATKIHKVLKAILKLEPIPKEEEFKFKLRSQSLLDKWNKTLTSEDASAGAAARATSANGVNGTSSEAIAPKAEREAMNGVKPNGVSESSKESEKEETKADSEVETNEATRAETVSKAKPVATEKAAEENDALAAEPTVVESTE